MKKSSPSWRPIAWAVFVGFLACVVLTTLVDVILHASGVFPPWGQVMSGQLFWVALTYRFFFDGLSSYITARLAPEPRWRTVWIGGALGLLMGILGIVAGLKGGPAMGPLWYPVILAVSVPLTTLIGGWIRLGKPSF